MASVYVLGGGDDILAQIVQACGKIGCDVTAIGPGTPEHELLTARKALDTSVLGIFWDGGDTIPRGDHLADMFLEKIPEPGPDFELTVTRIVAARIASSLKRTDGLYAQSTQSLSALRALLAETQKSFVLLEHYAHSHTLVRPQTRLAVVPGTEFVAIGASDTLVQKLPHNPYGLCGITLHLAKPLGRRARIIVELLLGPDETAATWEINGPQRSGPIKLALAMPLVEEVRTPWLRLQATPAFGSPTDVSLASNRMTKRWTAQLNDKILDFALALSLQFAPPGVRMARRQNEIRPSAAVTEIPVADKSLVIVDDWSTVTIGKGPTPADWMIAVQEDGSLQIHPFEGGITAAYMEDVALADWSRLRADVLLGHEKAPRVAFALAVLPGGPRGARLKDNTLAWAPYKTDWLELKGDETATLTLDLGENVERGTVYMMTMLRDTRSDYAWARWGQLFLER